MGKGLNAGEHLAKARLLRLDANAVCFEESLGELQRCGQSETRSIQMLLELAGDDVGEVFAAQVDGLVTMQRFVQAEQLSKQWLQLSAEDPRAWFARGRVCEPSGDNTEALAAYHRASELAPQWASALLAYADQLRRANRVDDGIRAYRSFLKLQPKNVHGMRGLAEILVEANREAEANELLSAWLEMDSTSYHARLFQGVLSLQNDRPKAAIETLEPLLSEFEFDQELNFRLSAAYHAMGELDQSKQALDRYDQANAAYQEYSQMLKELPGQPINATKAMRLATVIYAARFSEAIPWLHSVVGLNPRELTAYEMLVCAYRKLGCHEEAHSYERLRQLLMTQANEK
jgi:tetratricopeptide (TPR) repeat protein